MVALVPCVATAPTVRPCPNPNSNPNPNPNSNASPTPTPTPTPNQVRPRRLFYELKLLWRLGGGCVVQHNSTGIAPPYDVAAHPRCGEATAAAAAEVSRFVFETFYIDDGPMVTSFSLLPGGAALMPNETQSPGSLTHLLGLQLNLTAALLVDLRGSADLHGPTADTPERLAALLPPPPFSPTTSSPPPLPPPPPECTNITLTTGWQMISFNCIASFSSVSDVLRSAPFQIDDKIESREPGEADLRYLATYNGTEWVGDLVSRGLSPTRGYKIKYSGAVDAVLHQEGPLATVEDVVLSKGWNWIGHAPLISYGINSGIATVLGTFTRNDEIKTRTVRDSPFTTYTGSQFEGGLSELKPGIGYQVKVAQPVTFRYMPTLVAAMEPESARLHAAAALWEADRRFGSAACLAQLADSFLRDLETDGCPYQVKSNGLKP